MFEYSKYEEVLLNVPLFKDIKPEELVFILNCFNPVIKNYSISDNITLEGHDYTGVGILLKGHVTITKINEAGERIIMAQLETGGVFGEMVAFSSLKVWPATVIAKEYSTVMFIKPETIINHCQRMCVGHKQIMLNMLHIVSDKALGLNRKVNYLSIKSMRGKIAKFLTEEYEKNKKSMFEIKFNRNELSEFLHVSRPSMSRELSRMKNEGIIDYYQATFKIIDIEKLNDFASHLN